MFIPPMIFYSSGCTWCVRRGEEARLRKFCGMNIVRIDKSGLDESATNQCYWKWLLRIVVLVYFDGRHFFRNNFNMLKLCARSRLDYDCFGFFFLNPLQTR
jgi:hypothetical protein